MDTSDGAGASAGGVAGADAMDTGEVRATGAPAVRRPVLKRGAASTKQRRRKAVKAAKAAAVAGRRAQKAVKKGAKKSVRAQGKALWSSGGEMKE